MSVFDRLKRMLSSAPSLSPSEYANRHGEGTLLDVRTPGEYAQEHLQGAQNIDVMRSDFKEQVAPLDQDSVYYLYCRSGNRSGKAAGIMSEMGFEAYNVGGLAELKQTGLPTR